MQTVVDRAVLLQQVSDYAVQQLLCQMQARMEHLENTVTAMVAAADGKQARARLETVAAVAAASDEKLRVVEGVGEKALRGIREKVA